MKTKKCPGVTATRSGGEPKGPHENNKYCSTSRNACQISRRKTRTMDTAEKPNYWAMIPASVRYDTELPPMARLLYAEISSLTDLRGFCFASNAYFMRLFGFSERTLQRHLRALEKNGCIRVEDGDGGSGRRKIYGGINPLNGNPDKNDGVTPSKMSPNPVKNVTQINKENNKGIRTPQSPPEGGEIWDPEAFDAFWQLYPKKKDKAKAVKEWNRLKADRKLMRVMSAALRRQMSSEEWQRDNGRAIPYPCRWLSHRRWEDQLEVDPLPQQKEADERWFPD